jgi:hypothetical protein
MIIAQSVARPGLGTKPKPKTLGWTSHPQKPFICALSEERTEKCLPKKQQITPLHCGVVLELCGSSSIQTEEPQSVS